MTELTMYLVAGFVLGFLLAKQLNRQQMAQLEKEAKDNKTAAQIRVTQAKMVRRLDASYKEALTAAMKHLPLSEDRKLLLEALDRLLVGLAVPTDIGGLIDNKSNQTVLLRHRENVVVLLRAVNNGALSILWKQGTYASVYEMVVQLVSQPSSANQSDFGALAVDTELALPSISRRNSA